MSVKTPSPTRLQKDNAKQEQSIVALAVYHPPKTLHHYSVSCLHSEVSLIAPGKLNDNSRIILQFYIFSSRVSPED
jgi:hypothetical protein